MTIVLRLRAFLLLAWLLGCGIIIASIHADDPPANAADAVANEEQPAAPTFKKGAIIAFHGPITDWLEGYFTRKFQAARAAGCDVIVVEIDSPGGLLTASQEIAEQLQKASDCRTVAFVPREAISGGAYVALGCDEIIFHPTASFGDVGVIFRDEDSNFRYVPEKVRSFVVAQIRTLAEAKGRPPALAEAMVDSDCEVFRMRHKTTGKITFRSAAEIKSLPDRDDWEQLELVLESEKGKFLTVSGQRAVELQLGTATANKLLDVKQRYRVADGWTTFDVDNVDRAAFVLTLWWVTGLLIVCGLLGLVYELAAPGTCLGGLLALACFALFFWSRFFVGTSGLFELVLFALALVCLGVELFVLPGFGVAGIAGIALLGAALVLACQTFIIPQSETDWSRMGWSVALVGGAGGTIAVIAGVAIAYLGKIPMLHRLVLPPPETPLAEVPRDKNALTAPVKLGERGRAEHPLRPMGRGRFGDRSVPVVADGQFISRGALIEVTGVSEEAIHVREVSADASSSEDVR